MNSLANKRVVLGVTGSIAAYKSAELTRRLREAGAEVRVVMSAGATRFITPLTLQALSGNPVRDELFDRQAEAAMGHIELARWADLVLVAPASADCLARLAQGRADDLLGAVCLASEAPLLVAPAMNRAMWAHPATRDNCERLRVRGVRVLGPDSGSQACGEQGEGRMLEVGELVSAAAEVFESGALQGRRVLISAGPTREPIDPVRYLSNRSSGKMGFALAEAAAEAGAAVTLVSGPVALATPPRVRRVDVETAAQMFEAIVAEAAHCDIFISAAAVADYRPRQAEATKIKKAAADWSLPLEPTVDILAHVAALQPAPFTVGFAAETEQLLEHAGAKLQRKGLDMVAANQVGPGVGFDSDENALEVMWAEGAVSLPQTSKRQLARRLIQVVAERYNAKNPSQDS